MKNYEYPQDKKNIRPDLERADSDTSTDFSLLDFTNVNSATDCTGLIPSLPTSDAELDSYEDLYPFLPPILPKKTEKEKKSID